MYQLYKSSLSYVALTALTFVSLSIGCTKPDPLNRQAVSGTVIFGGEPLEAGAIEFITPTFMSGAPITKGTFKIEKALGLPPGEYTIRVSSPDLTSPREALNDAPGETRLPRELIPEEFNMKSQVKRTVEAGGGNQFTIEIPDTRKPASVKK